MWKCNHYILLADECVANHHSHSPKAGWLITTSMSPWLFHCVPGWAICHVNWPLPVCGRFPLCNNFAAKKCPRDFIKKFPEFSAMRRVELCAEQPRLWASKVQPTRQEKWLGSRCRKDGPTHPSILLCRARKETSVSSSSCLREYFGTTCTLSSRLVF